MQKSLFLLASFAGVASADITVLPGPTYSLTPQYRVDTSVNNYKASRKFKGAVVVVIDHGKRNTFFYGSRDGSGDPFSYDTPLSIASNTKTFVGTMLAVFDRYTTLKKTAQLHTLIPSLSASAPPYTATLEDLVDYWSGLPRDLQTSVSTRDDLYQTLNQCASWSDPCLAPEGTSVYSNYGFDVLGNVLAQQQGYAKWSDFNAYFVTQPLGLTATCARGDGCHPSFSSTHAHPFAYDGSEVSLPAYDDVTAPGGGLWSTATDMGTWMLYNLGNVAATSDARTWLLDGVLPDVQSKLHGNAGYAWKFSTLTFSDGTTSTVRWKLGRYQGLNSYIGLADDRDTGVFVFVNRDGSDPALDPGPDSVLRQELGEPILAWFP